MTDTVKEEQFVVHVIDGPRLPQYLNGTTVLAATEKVRRPSPARLVGIYQEHVFKEVPALAREVYRVIWERT